MGFCTFPHPHPTKKGIFRNDLWSDHLENTLVNINYVENIFILYGVSPTKTLLNSDNIIFCYLEGRKYDAAMLKDSHLLDDLNAHPFSATGVAMCLCGDPAYPH